MAKSIDLAPEASRLATLLLSYIPARDRPRQARTRCLSRRLAERDRTYEHLAANSTDLVITLSLKTVFIGVSQRGPHAPAAEAS